jgi:hypothetical protein
VSSHSGTDRNNENDISRYSGIEQHPSQ